MKIDTEKWTLIWAMLIISACSNNVEDDSAKGSIQGEGRLKATKNSSFVAERVRIISHTVSSEHSEKWSDLATHALIEIETCLKDISQAQAVIDQRFSINTPFGEQKRFTQTNGCLSWSDIVPFSSLAQEKLYHYPVTITGLGRYPGHYQLNLAVNPWAKSTAAVIDLDHHKTAFEISHFQNTNNKRAEEHNSIEIQSLKLTLLKRTVESEGQSELLTYDLEMSLGLQVLDIQGSRTISPLTNGEFHLQLGLIEKKRDEQINQLTSMSEQILNLKNGRIKEQIVLRIPRENYPLHHSQMELMIKLSPQSAPQNLAIREGLLDMDGLRAVKNQTLREIPDGLVHYTLKNDEDRVLKTDEALSFDENFGFQMGKVSLRWGSLLEAGDHRQAQRSLRANFSVCLKDPLSTQGSRPITDTDFSVVVRDSEGKADSESRTSKVGPDGCLHSFFLHQYNLFEAPTWIPLTLELTGLNGEVKGITKRRTIEINPWTKEDFGYDTVHESAPVINGDNAPKIFLADIGYSSEGNNLQSYRINKFMQLSFSKDYQIQLSPKIESAHSTNDQRQMDSLTFGQYKMDVFLFSPKGPEVDYYDIDLQDFHFLTAASREVSINPHGDIVSQISLPFYFTEFNQLPYRNIIVVKLTSTDGKIESDYFATSFFGNDRNARLKAIRLSADQAQRIQTDQVITKLKNTGYKDVEKVLTAEQSQLTPLQYYRRELRRTLTEQWGMEGSMILTTRSELNQRLSLGSNALDEDDKTKHALSYEDLRTLSTEGGQMPIVLTQKFCRHFYLKPKSRLLSGIGPSRSSTVGGEDYTACLKNPSEYLDTKGLTHIENILSQGREQNAAGQTERFGTARLTRQDVGEISHGGGFFAAYGDRAADMEGEQEALTFKKGAELFLQAPPPMMMVFNAGVSHAHEIFTQKSTGKMQMTFDRNYRQLGRLSLEYNMIELEFNAQVLHCVAVMPLKAIAIAIHVCQDNSRLAKMKEEWYFIARKDIQRVGTITDAMRVGMNNETQLIRGRYHFNKAWELYKSEDVAILLKEITGQEIYAPLVAHKLYENNDLFFKQYKDQNFPGVITPALY